MRKRSDGIIAGEPEQLHLLLERKQVTEGCVKRGSLHKKKQKRRKYGFIFYKAIRHKKHIRSEIRKKKYKRKETAKMKKNTESR